MQTITIIILCLLGLSCLLHISSIPFFSYNFKIILLLITNLLSLFQIMKYSKKNSKEKFYFEVSPEKEKCMEERVSLEQPPGVRSKDCCPVYTTGGKLKYVEEWKQNTDNPIHWQRTDNWVDSKEYNTYKTQLAPTVYVKN